MEHSWETKMLELDRQDLLELLRMRYGDVPQDVREAIDRLTDPNTVQRLILAAANAASWEIFVEELQAGDQSFKLIGERFSPI